MKKSIIIMFCCVLMASCLIGCNDTTSQSDENQNNKTDLSSSLQPDENQEIKPAQEVIDADLSSGLIQIDNYVFRNGGYITVGEFIEQYGDGFDTVNNHTVSKIKDLRDVLNDEVKTGWRFTYEVFNKTNGATLEIMCKEPVGGNGGKIKDAVIVGFIPGDGTEYIMYPTGIKAKNSEDKNFFKNLFENEKLEFIPYPSDRNVPLAESFDTEKNVGKYSEKQGDNYYFMMGSVELDTTNLYGYTPKLFYVYSHYDDLGDGGSFSVDYVVYDFGKGDSNW